MTLHALAPAFEDDVGERSASPRRLLLELYRCGLKAVDPQPRVTAALADAPREPTAVIALGKAASSMMAGAQAALQQHIVRAILVTDHADPRDLAGSTDVQWFEGDHPVPGERSLTAGAALGRFLEDLPVTLPVLVLLSGGASSLVEEPLPGVTLAHLQRLNEWAHCHDIPITALNALRRRLSAIKGGRLAARLAGRPARALVLSDVPGDDPRVVGSGLVAAPAGAELPLPAELPDDLRALVNACPVLPAASLPVTLVGTLTDALDAVVQRAESLGLRVERLARRIDGSAESAARQFVQDLIGCDVDLLIGGGETTVRLPENPGVGGRCQQFALAAALGLEQHPDLWLLAAGTDGRDGMSPDAGGLVDAGTAARARQWGEDPADALRRADAGTCLAASGDLIATGSTGTNVGDLVIGLNAARAQWRWESV